MDDFDESNDDLSISSSVETSSDKEEVINNVPTPPLHGNRLFYMILLRDGLEKHAGCRRCREDEVKDFVCYCSHHGCDVASLYESWQLKRCKHNPVMAVEEETHALAARLILCCN
jgi:hypothetical protein